MIKKAGSFSSTLSVLRSAFPGAFFTGTSGNFPLSIDLRGEAARYIRLRLPRAGTLHLHSIEIAGIDAEGVKFSPEMGVVKASSHYSSAADLVARNRFLLPKKAQRYGFHTEREEGPSVTVDLSRLFAVEKIMVWNRDDGFQWRANGVVIETSQDGNAWAVQYDGDAEAKLLHQCLASLKNGFQLGDDASVVDCVALDILSLLLRGERKVAEDALKKSRLPKKGKLKVAAELNGYLQPFGLEWNIHGIRRTFRYWSASEKIAYLSFCNDVCRSLSEISKDVCVGFGSVLSLVRNRDLIPHDDDLDILISFPSAKVPTIKKALSLIERHFEKTEFEVRGDHLKTHRWVSQKGGKSVDVFVGLEEDGFVAWYPQRRGTLPYHEVFPPIVAPLLGVDMKIPKNPFTYLQAVYGENWHIPDSGWRHNWDISAYSDIM